MSSNNTVSSGAGSTVDFGTPSGWGKWSGFNDVRQGERDAASVTGFANDVLQQTGDTALAWGDHNNVKQTGAGSTASIIFSNYDQILQAGNDNQASVSGDHNSIDQQTNSNTVDIRQNTGGFLGWGAHDATGNQVVQQGGEHNAAAIQGANNDVTQDGSHNRVDINGDGNQVLVKGNGNHVTLADSNTHVRVYGDNYTVQQNNGQPLQAVDQDGRPVSVVRGDDGTYTIGTPPQ